MKTRIAVCLLAVASLRVVADLATLITLSVPGRTNANVSLAVSGPFVAAVWSASESGGATDIYAAVSHDSGASFGPHVRVNATPGDARVNGEQPPRVALVPRRDGAPSIVVVWTSKGGMGTRILWARSDDQGRTFGVSALVPSGEAAGNRGWESLTVDAGGNVRVLWLDHREMSQATPAGGAAHTHAGHDASPADKKDGAAMAELSKLYVATVGESGSARMLLGGVCYCCKTALATGGDGVLYAAWRHVYPGNLRDMAFMMSRDGRTFLPPVRVSEDQWQLEGCPDDGPAMAVDDRDGIHLVWPTLVTDAASGKPSIGIFYTYSTDGRTFRPRQRLATEGLAHHPQIAVVGDELVAAWDELQNGVRRIVVARRPLSARADATFSRVVVSVGDGAIYPALAGTARGPLLAWVTTTEGKSAIRVATLGR